MIVRYESDDSIVMITQNDHAQLSGLFASHWGNAKFESRGLTHRWCAPRCITTAAGFATRPAAVECRNRKTPSYREVPNDAAQLEAFQWAGDWLGTIDPYAGLMIARHRTGLWQGR